MYWTARKMAVQKRSKQGRCACRHRPDACTWPDRFRAPAEAATFCVEVLQGTAFRSSGPRLDRVRARHGGSRDQSSAAILKRARLASALIAAPVARAGGLFRRL